MKTAYYFKTTLFCLVLIFCSFSLYSQDKKKVKHDNLKPIFNGKNLSNWTFYLKDPKANPDTVFKVVDGKIVISGFPVGYIRTKTKYSDFNLKLEWRWTNVLANSGVLLHTQNPDSVWPECYQVQLKAGDAGDIICMNGLNAKECTDKVKFTIKKSKKSNEKELAQWNSVEIICLKNTMEVYINGELQNKATELTANEGFIGFQGEGKPLEIRNIVIKSLK